MSAVGQDVDRINRFYGPYRIYGKRSCEGKQENPVQEEAALIPPLESKLHRMAESGQKYCYLELHLYSMTKKYNPNKLKDYSRSF